MDLGKRLATILCGIVMCWTSVARGWGGVGHQILAESAAQVSSNTFWVANELNLGILTNVPDKYWRSGKTGSDEAQTHFYEPDAYVSDQNQFWQIPRKWNDAVATYGKSTVIAHGTAVWRFQQLKNFAENALATNDLKQLLQMAGVMSHYLADLSQPLHVTINYDGQLTSQNGIHKFFETTNLSNREYDELKLEVTQRALLRLQDAHFVATYSTDPETLIFNLVNKSYTRIQMILDVESQLGRKGPGAEKMYEMALDYMADGAAVLSLVLDQIIQKSPKAIAGQTLNITIPSWVAPDYSTLRGRKKKVFQQGFFQSADFSDRSECDGIRLQ